MVRRADSGIWDARSFLFHFGIDGALVIAANRLAVICRVASHTPLLASASKDHRPTYRLGGVTPDANGVHFSS
jgi:hypothetical protein